MPILKKLALLSGLTLVAVMGLTTFAQAGYETLEQARAAAEKANKPLLIDFYTEW